MWGSLYKYENAREDLFEKMNEDEKSQLIIPFSYKDYLHKLKNFSRSLNPIYLLL